MQPSLKEFKGFSIWLHPFVTNMKFTAYGFFAINYNSLCGFMTAIITYLVIFIQFYAIQGNLTSDHISRAGESSDPTHNSKSTD